MRNDILVMKVLIANPPAYLYNPYRHFIQAGSRWSHSFFVEKPKEVSTHYLPYPFYIGYASALLKSELEVDTKAIDACALDFDHHDFTKYVESYNPDILIVEVPTVSFPLVMRVLKSIKELDIECKIAVAGPHITALTSECMEEYPFIDYALLGEYELTLKELVSHLSKGLDIKYVKGLAYRREGKVFINERRELLTNLDSLPFPDREDLDITHYHDFEIAGSPSIQMWSSRGCPFNCSFCLERQVIYARSSYRKRSSSKIVDEMEFVKEKYRAKQVYFDDETMTIDKEHIKAIVKEILNRKLDIPWACMADITIDKETLELMAKSGLVGIKFGVETVSEDTLRKIGKNFVKAERALEVVKWCKEFGIWTHATYMIGLPYERKEDILLTLEFAKKLDTDSIQVSIATPFPGTPFFKLVDEMGWLVTKDWTMYDGANYAVVSYPHLTADEIEKLCSFFYREWKKFKIRSRIRNAIFDPRLLVKALHKHGLRNSLRLAFNALSGKVHSS